MALCLLGLGSNLGDRRQHLAQAIRLLAERGAVDIVAKSRLYETKAAGGPAFQPRYLNAVVLVDTSLSPVGLLDVAQRIEEAVGRQREVRWGPRSLDIDLLLYEDVVLEEPRLSLPHPRMGFRRFVLEPAAEIAAAFRHPVFGFTVFQLLERLDEAAPYLAITGPPGCGKSAVMRQVAKAFGLKALGSTRGLFADQPPSARTVPWRKPTRGCLLRRFLRQEGRLLFRRSQLLSLHLSRWKWSEIRGIRLLTDFWPWESLVVMSVLKRRSRRWPGRARALVAAIHEQFREMLADYVPLPKLLVYLDYSRHTLSCSAAESWTSALEDFGGPPPAIRLRQLAKALRQEVAKPHRGAWLRLVDASAEEAMGEIHAALEAMEFQPTPLRESLP